MFEFSGVKIAVVGPLPPPHGGMANQTQQLARLLAGEGADVHVVRTNAPYRPRMIERVRGVRALFRLAPYVGELWGSIRETDLCHIMANSGLAWHLFAAPALAIARLSGTSAVLHYHGGDAEKFLARSPRVVGRVLRYAREVVVPSRYLRDVFANAGVRVRIVPNVIDLERFQPRVARAKNGDGPRVLIARNLERVYDVETGIRAFARLHAAYGGATLDVVGSGPERQRLESLTKELRLTDSIRFLGRVDNDHMPALYGDADIALNTSRVDNMPVSILEALASGVPVVSTEVGGIPAMVEDQREAVLVPAQDVERMANALVSLWASPEKRAALRSAGLEKAQAYGWNTLRDQWGEIYSGVLAREESFA